MVAEQPPRRHVLVPAHRPDADQAQHPARRRRRREAEPLSRCRGWLDDEFLSNTVFGALTAGANRVPGRDPADEPGLGARRCRRAPTATSPTGSSPRRGGSSSARWSTPSRARPGSTRSARRGGSIDASDWRISFPVEIRVAPADDIPLSTASGRDSFYLAFHTHHRSDWRTHAAYFEAMERIMRDHDGRPHWGKLHTRTAADLAPAYPRFGEFLAMRDRLDPDRVFANAYLRRVLGRLSRAADGRRPRCGARRRGSGAAGSRWRRLGRTGAGTGRSGHGSGSAMVHLRLTGVSEDGRTLLLVSDAGVEFTVDVDDRLRAALGNVAAATRHGSPSWRCRWTQRFAHATSRRGSAPGRPRSPSPRSPARPSTR